MILRRLPRPPTRSVLLVSDDKRSGLIQSNTAMLRPLSCVLGVALLASCATSPSSSTTSITRRDAVEMAHQTGSDQSDASAVTHHSTVQELTFGLAMTMVSAEVLQGRYIERSVDAPPSANDQWVAAASTEGHFTADLPGRAVVRDIWFEYLNTNQPVSAESLASITPEKVTVVVTRMQYPNSIEAARHFANVEDAFASAGSSVRKLRFRGYPAVEMQMASQVPDSVAIQRVIAVDADIFWLSVLGQHGSERSIDRDASRVFKSLRFDKTLITLVATPANALPINAGYASPGYADKVRRQVRPSLIWAGETKGVETTVEVRCATSGTLLRATIVRSSGNSKWDAVALRAVWASNPMPVDANGKAPSQFLITLRPGSGEDASGPAAPPSPLPPGREVRVDVAGDQLICRTPPAEYPHEAQRLHQTGTVVVRITMWPPNKVKQVTITKSSGSASIDAAAITAAASTVCTDFKQPFAVQQPYEFDWPKNLAAPRDENAASPAL